MIKTADRVDILCRSEVRILNRTRGTRYRLRCRYNQISIPMLSIWHILCMNRITGEAIEVPVIKYYRIEAILYSYSFQQLDPPPVWFGYAIKWKSSIARLN